MEKPLKKLHSEDVIAGNDSGNSHPSGFGEKAHYLKGILAAPPSNKGLIAGLIKGNQWLINP